jgi:hypothetical protein
MSEYSNVIQGMFGTDPATDVTANINANPDGAARSIELSRATGVAAPIINSDVESFETTHKAAMASSLVSNNAYIADYVNSHPLASSISNDDYGNLDNVSQKLGVLGRARAILGGPRAMFNAADSAAARGFKEGFGPEGLGSWLRSEDIKNHPFSAAVVSTLAAPLEGILRIGSGAMRAVTEGVGAAAATGYEAVSGDQANAQRFARDISGIVEMQMTPGAAVHGQHPIVAQALEATTKAAHWIRAGEEPPAGVHPMIDQMKVERNKAELDLLDQAVQEAQNSTTKERAPELFGNFVKQHVGESQMGISGQRVLELYGDKTPLPDDGILGWVPGIEDQLRVARETGADVTVPLGDWISKVDPAVAKELHDDLRVAKGGITNREAAELPAQPIIPSVDEIVPSIRNTNALEPLFSIGDRKLSLQRLQPEGEVNPAFKDFHDFDLVNENGQSVGTINLSAQKGGKELYIEMINGIGEYYNPNKFGPSLMRDLLRQIKQEFPEAETLTGHRVTGARDAVGDISGKSALPVIKLSEALDATHAHEQFSKLLGGSWVPLNEKMGLDAYIKPSELLQEHEVELAAAVQDELKRIAPNAQSVGVSELRAPGTRGIHGAYQAYNNQRPLIVWAMNIDDSLGTARHEAIHHLYREGFFTPEEWSTLRKAAHNEDWLGRFDIHNRYSNLDENGKFEESIAEAYRNWVEEYETRSRQANFQQTPLDKIFSKIKEFLDAIRQRIGELIGKEPTFEDLFQRVDSGEIGSRQPTMEGQGTALSVEGEGLNANPDIFRSAKDVGMTVEQYRRYMKLIEDRQQADIAKSSARIEKEQAKRQTQEWKDQSEAMRPQVVVDLNARPDIAADKFFGLGEVYGEKLDKTYKLDWDFLTPEQQAALPERYTVRRGGVKADEVAPIFGYQTGAEMIEGISRISAAREASGVGRDRFMRRMIDDEINRRMEAEHGFLEKNILDEAMDQILSENQLDLLHEETHALGLMSGDKGFNLTRDQLQTQIKENFDKLRVDQISSEKFLQAAAKYGKAAEMELLRQSPAEAFKAKQAQYFATSYAQHARALEKSLKQLDRIAKPYQKGKVSAIDAEFVDHIQKLLGDAGFKIKRDPEELAHSLEFHGSANLPEFIRNVQDTGWDPIVSDAIQAGGVKPIDAMTAAEYSDFHDAIKSLNHIGRAIRKIEIAGEKQDFADFKKKVIDNITQLPVRPRDKQGNWFYKIDASITRMEEMVKDLDLRQELGPLWDAVIHPMVLSKSKEFDLVTDLAKHFSETKGMFDKTWRKSLDDTIPNDVIFDPYTNAFYDLSRQNLIQIMLNWGNRSNIDKYVQGAGFSRWGRRLTKEEATVYEGQIKALIDTHATAEDWKFVNRLWEPFKNWQPMMDTVARNTTGIAPPWIKAEAVDTPHGKFDGGYWPVKYDRLASGIDVIKERQGDTKGGVFGTDYFRAATSKGYLKQRSGYVDFVDISSSIEQAVSTMQQTIHDISFRDSLMQASKVFYDKDIRAAIRKHYGSEYEAQLIPWLKRISYQYSADDAAMKGFNDFLRRTRINLVGHSLPLNLKVILSPDIGVPNPAMWARFEANRSENTALAMEHSQEIRHLVYNLDRDYQEALNRTISKFGSADITKKALEWGYMPVAKVSQEFRMATFVDEFNKQKATGKTDKEAALLADSRVREQHGAASIVDLPAALSTNEAMKMLTIFQGYFNTMYNWQRQIPGQLRRGDFNKAFTTTMGSVVVGSAFGATLFNQRKEDDSWFKIIAKALVLQPLSTIPILSHAANYAFEGFSPRMPMASLMNAIGATVKDVQNAIHHKPLKKPISNAANAIGLTTGLPLAQIGRTSQFGYDVATGKQHPRNIGEYARGIITGEARLKK